MALSFGQNYENPDGNFILTCIGKNDHPRMDPCQERKFATLEFRN